MSDRRTYWIGFLASGVVANTVAVVMMVADGYGGLELVPVLVFGNLVAGTVAWRSRPDGPKWHGSTDHR